MQRVMFDSSDMKSGKDYGIQVSGDNLKIVLKILYLSIKYNGIPFRSHLGNDFNLVDIYNMSITIFPSKGKIGIKFSTKYWTSEFDKYGRANNFESKISLSQKRILRKIVRDAGFNITDSWNDKHSSFMVSLLTDTDAHYIKDCTNINISDWCANTNALCY